METLGAREMLAIGAAPSGRSGRVASWSDADLISPLSGVSPTSPILLGERARKSAKLPDAFATASIALAASALAAALSFAIAETDAADGGSPKDAPTLFRAIKSIRRLSSSKISLFSSTSLRRSRTLRSASISS